MALSTGARASRRSRSRPANSTLNAGAPGRTGPAWAWAWALVVVAAALAAWAWQDAQIPAAPRATTTAVLASPRVLPAAGRIAAPSSTPATAVAAASNFATAPIASEASAPDLRRVYEAGIGSADPRLRRAAARAYAACVPLFVPNAGETPSPEPMIQALPDAARAQREQAYRALFARCRGFVAERPPTLAAMGEALLRDAQSQDLGQGAREALLAGRADEAASLLAQALNGDDPAAIATLGGLVEQLARADDERVADPNALARARAVDAALPAAACELGLDCGPATLKALQLCAVEGWCDGDVAARIQAGYGPGTLDVAAVETETKRLVALLRSGRALGLADLLP